MLIGHKKCYNMKIAVSIGDMNGIGLECFAKALFKLDNSETVFLLFAPKKLVFNYLDIINQKYSKTDNGIQVNNHQIEIIDIPIDAQIEFGVMSTTFGQIAAKSIEMAVESIKEGKSDVLLTLPINKKAINLAGFDFPGHTEMLGKSFGSEPLMILFTGEIRVALVTVHLPIRNIADKIRQNLIESKYSSLEKSLRIDFGIAKPRIAVLGLNPHAGEQGNIGIEELAYINDTIDKLNIKYKTSKAEGPYPADGFFGFGQYKKYDGILAMYHDQGLIPLKLLANGGGVNFTANLSAIRVSPDHGTAYNIAGKNQADETSTYEAIQSGISIYKNRTNLF